MAVIYSPGLKKINHSFGVLLWDLLLPKELRERRFYSVVNEHSKTVPCTGKLRLYSNTAEALLTDTLGSGYPTYGRLHKTPIISTPVQTLYFYIPLSGQL